MIATRPITKKRLENIALFYLKRFSSSSDNLKFVLEKRCQKSHHPNDLPEKEWKKAIEQIISHFQQIGYLNDTLYAETLTQRLYREGKSKSTIKQTLTKKRVPKHIIEARMQAFYQDDDEQHNDLNAAQVFVRKKRFGPYRTTKEVDQKRIQKEMASMMRHGFSYDIIKQVLNQDPYTE